MNFLNNPTNKGNAQRLRREMTKEERHLWYDFFKTVGIHANRQKPIGPYIVDFYIAAAKLVIEVDGSQHYSAQGQAYDRERSEILERYGLRVLRFSNYEIDTQFSSVCDTIYQAIKERMQVTTNDQL